MSPIAVTLFHSHLNSIIVDIFVTFTPDLFWSKLYLTETEKGTPLQQKVLMVRVLPQGLIGKMVRDHP